MAGPVDREADHCPGDGSAERRAVACRGGGDREGRSSRRLEASCRPWRQPEGVAAESPGPRLGGQDERDVEQQGSAGVVEIVAVVVVAEEDRIYRAEGRSGYRGAGQLA